MLIFPLFHSAPALTLSLPFAAHPRSNPALGEFHVPCSCSQCRDRAVQHCGTLEHCSSASPVSADADQSALLEPNLQGLQPGSVCVQALPVSRCCRMDWCEHLTAPLCTAACSEDAAVAESSRFSSTPDCSEEVSSRAVRGLLGLTIQFSPSGQQPFQLSDR